MGLKSFPEVFHLKGMAQEVVCIPFLGKVISCFRFAYITYWQCRWQEESLCCGQHLYPTLLKGVLDFTLSARNYYHDALCNQAVYKNSRNRFFKTK